MRVSFVWPAIAVLVFLATAPAFSSPPKLMIATIPEEGSVTVTGRVERVDNERAFRLRDDTGMIDVQLDATESEVLKEGDRVSVTGEIKKTVLGEKSLAASRVDVHKGLPTVFYDAVTETTGLSMHKAQAVDIAKLPDAGLVKLTGQVKAVDNEKHFILQDRTGSVDVNIQSREKVMLAPRSQVTVLGYIDGDAAGKNIRATHVMVKADSQITPAR